MIAAKQKQEAAPIDPGERQSIPVGRLRDSPFNPRKTFNAKKVSDIAASMKQLGQLQPIVVRLTDDGDYEIAAGHTRKRAAVEADLPTLDAIVRDLSDDDMIVVGLVENGDRDDLPPLEEADAYNELVKRGWDVARIADRTGKSDGHVRRRLQLAKVIPEARQAVADGKLLANAAALLARLESPADQRAALERALKTVDFDGARPISADDIEHTVRMEMRVITEAPFDVKDAKLLKGAKPCAQCPKRTGAQVEMYPEVVDDKDRCLDGDCWGGKLKAHDDARVEAFEKRGLPILDAAQSARIFPNEGTWASGGHVALDTECYAHASVGSERKTWGELVGAIDKGVFIAFDGDGRPREVMKEADARKAAGFKDATPPKPSKSTTPAPRDEDGYDDDSHWAGQEAPSTLAPAPPIRSLEDEHAIVAAIVNRCVKKQDVPVFKMLRRLVDPDADFEAIARRRGWSEDQVGDRVLSPTSMADAVGLLVEMLIAGPLLEDQRATALETLGLDADEILDGLRAKKAAVKSKKQAKRPKPPPKKKPAKQAKRR